MASDNQPANSQTTAVPEQYWFQPDPYTRVTAWAVGACSSCHRYFYFVIHDRMPAPMMCKECSP
jgi:hypothetical protein